MPCALVDVLLAEEDPGEPSRVRQLVAPATDHRVYVPLDCVARVTAVVRDDASGVEVAAVARVYASAAQMVDVDVHVLAPFVYIGGRNAVTALTDEVVSW